MAELPAGTVTFLFTDVEGSTRLLHELGDGYAEVLAEHRRALRHAFACHDGVEVDTQGDAFFVAFAKASDALAAAADACDALAAGPIRVRIGLHTGEPLMTEEGYVGIDVHRAARIASAGHGGQILVSQSTRDLVGSDFLRDLGEHRLKDLTAPERIYQIGDDDFPPLKSLNQTNLPVQPTPLVGRERELREVLKLLGSARLLTLTGAGGSGKTRLALQVAAESVDEYPDGVWFVSLAAVAEAQLVRQAISSVVGAKDDLGEFLRPKALLLVLDNLEQLLPAVGPQVAELLAAPDVDVLATSRERLALFAEQEYGVPTMSVEDSVGLFTARARQLKPAFEADEHVERIARRLDGLPLALELAAARVKLMTPKQILERLGRSLELLTSGTLDAPERHRTLRATMEWSHGLLNDGEKALFARLAVFAGSFELESAEAVCDADLDVLQSLLDKSLLRQTEEGRFFMLETIGEYALERLRLSGGQEEIRRRHADHALSRANVPPGVEPRKWREAVDRDYADFRAALMWLRDVADYPRFLQLASRLGPYWDARVQLTEGRRWLEEALSAEVEGAPERARALVTLAHIAWRQGDAPAARSSLEASEAAARDLGDEALLAWAMAVRGGLEYTSGNLTTSREAYEEALALFRAQGAVADVTVMVHDLGSVALAADDNQRAREHLEESLRLSRENGFDQFEPNVLGSLGYLELAEGNVDQADHWFRESLRLALERNVIDPSTTHDLYGFAVVTALRNGATSASVLLGSCDAIVDLVGAALEPMAARAREEALRQTEERLGEDALVRARARGSEMSVVEAVEYALSID
jgi:predicted ATPase